MGPRSLRFHARFCLAFATSAILALGAVPPAPTPFTLIPGDPVSASNFGRAVSISGDTAVVGAPTKAHPLLTGSPASANRLSNAKTAPTVTSGGANAVAGFAVMSPFCRSKLDQHADSQACERQLSGGG
jgi:hypothetical protein